MKDALIHKWRKMYDYHFDAQIDEWMSVSGQIGTINTLDCLSYRTRSRIWINVSTHVILKFLSLKVDILPEFRQTNVGTHAT